MRSRDELDELLDVAVLGKVAGQRGGRPAVHLDGADRVGKPALVAAYHVHGGPACGERDGDGPADVTAGTDDHRRASVQGHLCGLYRAHQPAKGLLRPVSSAWTLKNSAWTLENTVAIDLSPQQSSRNTLLLSRRAYPLHLAQPTANRAAETR